MILDRIKTSDFIATVGYELPPEVMRLALRRMREYTLFQKEYRQGDITSDVLRECVQDLLGDFRRGEKFTFDASLAFLCVALESIFTPFATEFLEDLSKVHLVEMPLSPGVAKVCLEERNKLPSNLQQDFKIADLLFSIGEPFIRNEPSPPSEAKIKIAA